ncbi:PTS sugar transporter subunit IIA [Paraburkholderia sp. LEh10]|uniref:PTS sugar transporter subunit IIA n=1 Tax=Paraburkholderia sp. LEh10 TaxID=2821353 RepID=UPI001AE5A924|nr:PTS sugar transporter subunit IIA [Paraburkholderia sp. LEh10]MBP0595836.1 PTS sugar transporter subunit IIA [Paraburkholderia sp. LEh10]
MKHSLADLKALFGLKQRAVHRASQSAAGRDVVMRITLDAQHAMPLRQALIRDCAGQSWTIRMTPLHGTDRVRLILYLPRSALKEAMQRVTHLAPTAEIAQLLEVPDAPTDTWSKLMQHPEPPHGDAHARHQDRAASKDAIAHLLTEDHVLLDLAVASREALFTHLAQFIEQRYGLEAAAVMAGLAAREALGSTALGQGVAVPHGQITGLQEALALYVRPAAPIPFDAPDGRPVTDLVVLFVPEWANMTHLHLLAEVAERFCDQRFREQLHACADPRAVCRLFADFEAQDAAERDARHTTPRDIPSAVVKPLRPHS